jgi:hypothetical protein
MNHIWDHPLRYELANELHTRPFPSVTAPGTVAFLALKQALGKIVIEMLTEGSAYQTVGSFWCFTSSTAGGTLFRTS